MRLDLVLPNEGEFAPQALEAAAEFEAMGWDGLWFTDHIIGVDAFTAVYGPFWMEMLASMAFVAARTSRVRLGAGVLVAPYRDPVTTAKIVATIDVLSGGRFDLGVGTGWARREFIAVGRGDVFEDRGAFTDEVMDIMLRCWQGGRVEFHGRWFNFEKITFQPVPLQAKLPIWIGARGLGGPPLRRAAKYADYWHPTGLTPDQVREGGEKLDALAGRKIPRTVRLRCDGDPNEVAARLQAYEAAGCVQAACAFDGAETITEFRRAVERFHDVARAMV